MMKIDDAQDLASCLRTETCGAKLQILIQPTKIIRASTDMRILGIFGVEGIHLPSCIHFDLQGANCHPNTFEKLLCKLLVMAIKYRIP